MGSLYKNVNEAKESLKAEIDKEIEEKGVWKTDTCPTGECFGWDMNLHYALEWFRRHTPENWHIQCLFRHECCEWTITEK